MNYISYTSYQHLRAFSCVNPEIYLKISALNTDVECMKIYQN